MANDGHGPSMKFSEPSDNRLVVAKKTVSVQFDKVRKQVLHKVQQIGPLLMSRDLRPLPWTQVSVKLSPQFRHLLTHPLKLRIGVFRTSKTFQILHILLQLFDFALALVVG